MAFTSAMLRKMLWGLESVNIDRRALLEGIVEESRLGEDIPLRDTDYYDIITRALELSQSPALGLLVGQREGTCFTLGAVGLHVSLSSTFDQALSAIVRYQWLFRDRQEVATYRTDESLMVQLGSLDAPLPMRWFLTEAALTAMQRLFVQFAGPGARPLEIWVDYPAPPHAALYSEVLGCDVRFEQSHAALIVSRASAERQPIHSQPTLAEELGRLEERRLGLRQTSSHVAEQVRELLRQRWKAGVPSMRDLAKQLGVSERTLRRRLAAEGVHFRTILAEGRCELAREMLQTGMGIKQVAYELGYGSSSAFHKAFRRWAGASPSAFVARERSVAA